MAPKGDAVRLRRCRAGHLVAAGLGALLIGLSLCPVPQPVAWSAPHDPSARLHVMPGGVIAVGDAQVRLAGLVPGATRSVGVLVKNGTATAVRLAVGASRVVERENGCTEPERDVDRSCEGGAGELGSALRVSLRTGNGDTTRSLPIREVRTRPLRLAPIAPGDSVWVGVELAVPATVGNRTQGDVVRCELLWRATGGGGESTATVPITAAGGGEPNRPGLALTGVPVSWLALLAAVTLGAGVCLARLGRTSRPSARPRGGPVADRRPETPGGGRPVRT